MVPALGRVPLMILYLTYALMAGGIRVDHHMATQDKKLECGGNFRGYNSLSRGNPKTNRSCVANTFLISSGRGSPSDPATPPSAPARLHHLPQSHTEDQVFNSCPLKETTSKPQQMAITLQQIVSPGWCV